MIVSLKLSCFFLNKLQNFIDLRFICHVTDRDTWSAWPYATCHPSSCSSPCHTHSFLLPQPNAIANATSTAAKRSQPKSAAAGKAFQSFCYSVITSLEIFCTFICKPFLNVQSLWVLGFHKVQYFPILFATLIQVNKNHFWQKCVDVGLFIFFLNKLISLKSIFFISNRN